MPWARSVSIKILSNDIMPTGLSERFYSSCFTVGLNPKRSCKLLSWTKLFCIPLFGKISVLEPKVEKL